MTDDKTTLRVLGIAGSLRAGETTRGFVRMHLEALRDWTLPLRWT